MRKLRFTFMAANFLCACVMLSGCATLPGGTSAADLHAAACATPAPTPSSPWHISRLYDCKERSLYIPYALWTGAAWDGNRASPCMHDANSRFNVNGSSWTTINGPSEWRHPDSGETYQVWTRAKVNGSKTQLFTCHASGIGRLYDSRGERVYSPGRCKFPAGAGWRLHTRRFCVDTSIEVSGVELTPENELASLSFKWWFGDTLDHIYRYAPERGMLEAWRQRRVN